MASIQLIQCILRLWSIKGTLVALYKHSFFVRGILGPLIPSFQEIWEQYFPSQNVQRCWIYSTEVWEQCFPSQSVQRCWMYSTEVWEQCFPSLCAEMLDVLHRSLKAVFPITEWAEMLDVLQQNEPRIISCSLLFTMDDGHRLLFHFLAIWQIFTHGVFLASFMKKFIAFRFSAAVRSRPSWDSFYSFKKIHHLLIPSLLHTECGY